MAVVYHDMFRSGILPNFLQTTDDLIERAVKIWSEAGKGSEFLGTGFQLGFGLSKSWLCARWALLNLILSQLGFWNLQLSLVLWLRFNSIFAFGLFGANLSIRLLAEVQVWVQHWTQAYGLGPRPVPALSRCPWSTIWIPMPCSK